MVLNEVVIDRDAAPFLTNPLPPTSPPYLPPCQVVLNEVVIDRGTAPFLTNLEAFCDGNFVTHVQVSDTCVG